MVVLVLNSFDLNSFGSFSASASSAAVQMKKVYYYK